MPWHGTTAKGVLSDLDLHFQGPNCKSSLSLRQIFPHLYHNRKVALVVHLEP